MWMDKTKINSKTQTLTSEKVQEMTGKSIENFENHWINNATCYHLAAKFSVPNYGEISPNGRFLG